MTKKERSIREDDPAYKPYDRQNSKKRMKNYLKKLNFSTWSHEQEKLYVEFLQNHKTDFIDIKQRKKNKVFVTMSLFLKKRGSDQCRSHHQKMSIKYGNINSIIEGIIRDKLSGTPNNVQIETQPKYFMDIKKQELEDDIQNQIQIQNPKESYFVAETPSDFTKNEEFLWECLNPNVWIAP